MNLEELRADHKAKHEAYLLAVKNRDEEERKLHNEATRLIGEKHDAPISLAYKEASDAFFAVEREHDRLVIEAANPPYPVGTELVQWDKAYDYELSTECWAEGGHGLVEIITPESEHPQRWTMDGFKKPVGTVVVRMLTTDDQPSKYYYPIENEDQEFHVWRTIGVDPNEE